MFNEQINNNNNTFIVAVKPSAEQLHVSFEANTLAENWLLNSVFAATSENSDSGYKLNRNWNVT